MSIDNDRSKRDSENTTETTEMTAGERYAMQSGQAAARYVLDRIGISVAPYNPNDTNPEYRMGLQYSHLYSTSDDLNKNLISQIKDIVLQIELESDDESDEQLYLVRNKLSTTCNLIGLDIEDIYINTGRKINRADLAETYRFTYYNIAVGLRAVDIITGKEFEDFRTSRLGSIANRGWHAVAEKYGTLDSGNDDLMEELHSVFLDHNHLNIYWPLRDEAWEILISHLNEYLYKLKLMSKH
ncbi:MAG: hypothetical protein Q9M91_01895 [Candidatus Dojkabacteria bacterium]|nr:hypothetical protein [Candidatus Dojkabacteria bacterium]MDQ7020576.1 hypothetical protein [Candidatus Dojkabacteria bacterium]